MYSFDSITEEWLKMDDSTIPMDFINTEQMDTSDQLNMFKDYVDNPSNFRYTYTLSAGTYTIKRSSGESYIFAIALQ